MIFAKMSSFRLLRVTQGEVLKNRKSTRLKNENHCDVYQLSKGMIRYDSMLFLKMWGLSFITQGAWARRGVRAKG